MRRLMRLIDWPLLAFWTLYAGFIIVLVASVLSTLLS
jgi:hypothetical protein